MTPLEWMKDAVRNAQAAQERLSQAREYMFQVRRACEYAEVTGVQVRLGFAIGDLGEASRVLDSIEAELTKAVPV